MTTEEKVEAVLSLAKSYAQIDGAHHKAWCLDQMVRVLTGNGYAEWVADYENDGEYEWDTGVAP